MFPEVSDLRRRKGASWAAWLLLLLLPGGSFAASTTIYRTGFEPGEGYDRRFTLVGQGGWRSDGSGGNGIFSETNGFPGLGQQAYVGAFPPDPGSGETLLAVWQPINLAPVPAATPIVKFSAEMEIIDSLNGAYDCFRWSLYNTNFDRLFTLDFDNSNFRISYRLDGTNTFVFTGQTFSNSVRYLLLVTMDFARNQWSATLDNTLLVTNQPLSTISSTALNIGDIDALWIYRNPSVPGNNLMVFDNYQITREASSEMRPELTNLGHVKNTSHSLRLRGEAGRRYAIEATADLNSWTVLGTNTANNGEFDFADTMVSGFPRRFYRARLVP